MNLLTSQSVHPGRRDGRSSPINIYLKACILDMVWYGMVWMVFHPIQSCNHSILHFYVRFFVFSNRFTNRTESYFCTDSFTDSRDVNELMVWENLRRRSFHPHTRSVYVCLCVSYVWRCLSRSPTVTSVSEYLCVSPVKCLCVFISTLSTKFNQISLNEMTSWGSPHFAT